MCEVKFLFAICILIASFFIVAGAQYLIGRFELPKALTSFLSEAVGVIGLVAALIGSIAVAVDAPKERTKPIMHAIPDIDIEGAGEEGHETCYDKQGAHAC